RPLHPLSFDEGCLSLLDGEAPRGFFERVHQTLLDDVDRMRGVLDATWGPMASMWATGTTVYRLKRSAWPLLLAWINNHLPRGEHLTLSGLTEVVFDARGNCAHPHPVTQALLRLRAQDDGSGSVAAYLPALGLEILQHAVRHGLSEMRVEEQEPNWRARLWEWAWGDDGLLASRRRGGVADRVQRAVRLAARRRLGSAARELAIPLSDPTARMIRGLIAMLRADADQVRTDLLAVMHRSPSHTDQARFAQRLGRLRPMLLASGYALPSALPPLPRLASRLLLDFESGRRDPDRAHLNTALRRYLSFYPEDLERRVAQCELLLSQNAPAAALVAVTVPGVVSDRLQRLRATALLQMQRPGRALAALQGVRPSPEGAQLRAQILAALQRPREALAALRGAPGTVDALGLAAALHRTLEQPIDAAEAERRLLDRLDACLETLDRDTVIGLLDALTPTEMNLWRRVGLWCRCDAPARALADYTQLQTLRPNSVPALRGRASALFTLGRAAEAEGLLRECAPLELMWLTAVAQGGAPAPDAVARIDAHLPEAPRDVAARLLGLRSKLRHAGGEVWGAWADVETSLRLVMTAEALRWRGALLAAGGWGDAAETCKGAAQRLERDPQRASVSWARITG
ncbi:MAG: hypothetical protein AAFV53_38185, partial [Myxococcota bacterium]